MSDSVTGRSVAGAAALEMGLSDRLTDGDVRAAALKLARESARRRLFRSRRSGRRCARVQSLKRTPRSKPRPMRRQRCWARQTSERRSVHRSSVVRPTSAAPDLTAAALLGDTGG